MHKSSFALLGACAVLAALTGCSEDHPMDSGDAGIVVPDSARPPDAFFYDAGPVSGSIGNACTADTDCTGTNEMCIGDPTFFPDGYCTATCDPAVADSCPMGSQCQDFGGGQMFCLLTCDPSVTTRQCNGRMGYGCANSIQLSGVCVGGCVDASDCGGTLDCDTAAGYAGACFTPGAAAGDPCTMDTECPSGGFCQDEAFGGWPGGACLVPGCDLAANTGCSGDAQCIAQQGFFGPPQGYCIDGCTTDTDCRTGYTCTASTVNPDRHYCAPGCTSDAQCGGGRVCNVGLGTCAVPFTGTVGSTCSRRDPTTCNGGTCLSERSSGFPATYCTYSGCGASEACPGTSICWERTGATNLCVAACTADTDCHTGYRCLHSDAADPSSPTACLPGCTSNTDCTSMGDVCNVGTGLCAQPFTTTQTGMPCTSDATCVGGRCLTESAWGYPGGECVYPGCSLNAAVTGAICPSMSTCIDDGAGDPDIGICAPTCTIGTSGCQTGYACTAIPGGTTTGACTPACTSDANCATGRTCDTATGLCG